MQLQATEENAKGLRDVALLSLDLQKAGLASNIDVAQSEAAATEAESQIPLLETAVKTSLHGLALLVGKEPTALYLELTKVQAVPTLQKEILAGLPSALLQRRPDLRQAERALAGATADVGAAIADLFPQFSLTGDIGYLSSKNRNLVSGKSANWSFGPSLALPIFDFGKISANIDAKFALKDQAFLIYKKTILTALQDVENALVAYNKEKKRHKALMQALAASQSNVALTSDLYRAGLNSFITVLQAIQTLQSTKLQAIQSERQP